MLIRWYIDVGSVDVCLLRCEVVTSVWPELESPRFRLENAEANALWMINGGG